MKIGFAAPVAGSYATPGNQLHVAKRAEELGYASLWTFQRLLYPTGPGSTTFPENYRSVADPVVTMAYLAGHTSRIRLGMSVLNMPFFAPPLMAKQLASLDIVSGGRLDVGLGIGWAPEEYAAVGASYRRRGRRADEYLRLLRSLWTDDVVDFHGDFFEVPSSRMDPKPVQRPHPPVLLGASAEPALRRAGRLTAGWMSSSRADLSRIGESIAVVKDAARREGRDPEALRFVCRGVVRLRPGGDPDRVRLSGSVEEIRGDLDYLREAGMTELFVDPNYEPEIASVSADPDESMRRTEELLEAFAPGS